MSKLKKRPLSKKRSLNKSLLFKNFLKIYLIGTICSLVPFLTWGLVLGSVSVLLASIIVTLVFHKELG